MKRPSGEKQESKSDIVQQIASGSDNLNPAGFVLREITYTKEKTHIIDGINGHIYDVAIVRLALGCVLISRMFTKYSLLAQTEYNSDIGIPLKGALIDAMGPMLYKDLLTADLIFWCGDPIESSICLTPAGENMLATLSMIDFVQPVG